MRDDIAARRKNLREAVAKLRNIALTNLERRGYDVRGKTPAQIRQMLKRPPTKRKSPPFMQQSSMWSRIELVGVGLLLVVVLTHVAEMTHFMPSMGWGQPDSPGHYLDLVSAIGGVAFVSGGLIRRVVVQFRKG